jgi:hypothetical protein
VNTHAYEPADPIRNYWRPAVIAAIESAGAIERCWPPGTRIATLTGRTREIALLSAKRILEEAVETEKRVGRRTLGMEQHVARSALEAVRALRAIVHSGVAA